jgi:hypothetical protein
VDIVSNSKGQELARSFCRFVDPLDGGAKPATAAVTAGEVCCSLDLDSNGSSGLLCCDGPKGTVVLLSTSWPGCKYSVLPYLRLWRMVNLVVLVGMWFWLTFRAVPTQLHVLCRILRCTQPRSSLHSTVILFVKSINTKGKKYQDWLEHSRAIIPTGSGDGSTAKQNPVRSPCKIGKLDDQFQF